MSAIVGILCHDNCLLDSEVPIRMVASLAHRGPDGRGIWFDEGVGLGHSMLWTTPESLYEQQPLRSQDGTLTLVSDARIDNREELIAALGLKIGPVSCITDADIILAAYQKWGDDCPAKLLGDFAFAIWNRNNRRFFCARDPIGVKSFYYYRQSAVFAFASEIKALFQLPEVPRELNEERVADHLIHAFDDQESTFFRAIHRLPPGSCMSVSGSGLKIRRYWALNPQYELSLKSDGEFEEAFRELFTESVRCRLRSAFPVGATLSGGLDSSSVSCVARQCLGKESNKELHVFSAIFPSLPEHDLRRIDERQYVRAALAGGGFIAHEVRADLLSPLGDLENILWHQDEPHVPFNLYMHLGIYRAARKQGVRVVLDGFDGDTTVSHGYERFPELARKFRWGTLLKEARAISRQYPNRSFSPWKVLRVYALKPVIPTNLCQLWDRMRGTRPSSMGSASVIAEEFARRVGIEARVERLRSNTPRGFRSAREAHLRSLESPLLPYALELADKAAAAHSLEARYPFFDRRLMEFCLALPVGQKLREGWPRSILRRAMQGVLPPEIQWRNSKADLSPNFHCGLRTMGRETLERLLAENEKAVEKFIDISALNRLYQRYTAHPSNPDAMTLFIVATFAAWMRQSGIGDFGVGNK